jgi:hypothetical protein
VKDSSEASLKVRNLIREVKQVQNGEGMSNGVSWLLKHFKVSLDIA